jgi:thioredoxin-like negative regulator of GroEL
LLELQATGVEVQIVDIDIHPELARRYNVGAVPMFIVSVSGEPVVRTNNIDVVVAMLLRVHH